MDLLRLKFTVILLLFNSLVFSQTYKGKILDTKKQPVAYATVTAINKSDTTVITGVSTNENGNFELIIKTQTPFYLEISFIGFETKKIMPTQTNLGTITLKEQAMELQEIVITASNKKQYADKSVYTFTQKQKEKARYAKDLLVALPELTPDPIEQTVKSIRGGKVLFLVNGIKASDNQIKSIPPENVVNIEYYDVPPSRFANDADYVVNIKTRNKEIGYTFGISGTSAVTTGFVNGSAYASYTKGNSNFGLEYNMNLRNYDNRQYQKRYKYELDDKKYQSETQEKDAFGYTSQNIVLRYTNALPDQVFQTKFSLSPFNNFSKGNGTSVFSIDNTTENHRLSGKSNSNYINPTLDIYYSKTFNKKSEIIFNVVGSHYTTSSYRRNQEWDINDVSPSNQITKFVFNNEMDLKAKQTGLVGEIAYNYKFKKGTLSSGYRVDNTHIENDLSNLIGKSKYNVNYLTQYFYSEYSGKHKKLTYRLGLGVTNIHNKSATTTDNSWTPNPKLVLKYNFTDNQSLRFISDYKSYKPWGSSLSPNVIQIAPNIVKRGNPNLKPSKRWKNNLTYNIHSKYFDIDVVGFYNYVNDYIASYYKKDTLLNAYALSYENANWYDEKGVEFLGAIKPFGTDILKLKVYLTPTQMNLKMDKKKVISHTYIRNNYSVNVNYKKWSIYYSFNIPTFSINGSFLNKDENQNHLFVKYKHKNWSFIGGFYWIGTPSKYEAKSLEGSLIDYQASTQIFNNKNMLVFGISYDFSKGKKLNAQKKLNNRTNGAVTF